MHRLYGINIADLSSVHDVDAVILAVSHDCFKNMSKEDFDKMYSSPEKVMIDVKGILDRGQYEAAGYHYWRL